MDDDVLWMARNLICNVTPSMAFGWYVRVNNRQLTRGDVVTVRAIDVLGPEITEAAFGDIETDAGRACKAVGCPPAEARLLKRVAAVAGDEIEILGEVVRVNGVTVSTRFTRYEARECAGFDLPEYWSGARTLEPGEVLLLADGSEGFDVRRSFDGRYSGAMSSELIEAIFEPYPRHLFLERRARIEARRALCFSTIAPAIANAPYDPPFLPLRAVSSPEQALTLDARE